MPRVDFAFSHRIRVRWSEVDPQDVVFNARYLDYADIAISEYYRAVRDAGLWRDADVQFHVRHATVDFRAPIRADELIDLFARTKATGRTSTTTLIEMHGAGEKGAGAEDLRAIVELVAVHVDLADHRPRPLPDWYAPAFARIDGASPNES